jgi:hypothetical protein
MLLLMLVSISIYDAVPPQEVEVRGKLWLWPACIIVIVGLAMADIVAK